MLKDMRSIIAPAAWNALRRHYKCLRQWINLSSPSKAWNDEPVVRHLNVALTSLMERIVGLPLVQSALPLSLFVQPGSPGFVYHTDTSPPFDITMDFVVDHEGPSPRPLYFCRKNSSGWLPIVERLDLQVGEAVIFRGAEMTHWGGDLAKDTHHSIVLLTWQVCD